MRGSADAVSDEVSVINSYWRDRLSTAEMTLGTVARYERVLESFSRFVRASAFTSLLDVDTQMCESFVAAPRKGGLKPAPATSRFRLTVVRDAYLGLVLAGIATCDPTSDLRVAQPFQLRTSLPLTPIEVARLRSAGRISPRDSLRPATVELALVGGSHLEIARAVATDVDLHLALVQFGSRSVELDAFACATLAARLACCRRTARRTRRPWNPSMTALALTRHYSTYPEATIAPGISSSLSRAMTRAGITRPGTRPASVREYAANHRYALTGDIEYVAAFLGLESLDVTRGFINPDWQAQFAEEVRAVGTH